VRHPGLDVAQHDHAAPDAQQRVQHAIFGRGRRLRARNVSEARQVLDLGAESALVELDRLRGVAVVVQVGIELLDGHGRDIACLARSVTARPLQISVIRLVIT
jgi:hypothetical protein